VRVIEDDLSAGAHWKEFGAHVALGSPADPDLVERAGQNVRTLMMAGGDDSREVMAAVAEGARLAGIGRLVVCLQRSDESVLEAVRAAGIDHVVLLTGRSRLKRLLGPVVPADSLAEAMDAADDLAGNPRLVLDLTREGGWTALGLRPP
jgi:hypothetical protein